MRAGRRFPFSGPGVLEQLTRELFLFFVRKQIPPEDAEDLLQEVLARLYVWAQKQDQQPDWFSEDLRRLEFTFAKTRRGAWFRRRLPERRRLESSDDPLALSRRPDPRAMNRTQALLELAWALADPALAEDPAVAAALHGYLDGWSYPELARALEIDEATARKRVSRGREKLRVRLSAPEDPACTS